MTFVFSRCGVCLKEEPVNAEALLPQVGLQGTQVLIRAMT